MHPGPLHPPTCACCHGGPGATRRAFLAIGGAALASLPLSRAARAASGDYEAMLVNCIDPRFTTESAGHMAANGMRGRYSHFVIAGGPIGAVHDRFASWHGAFWDNLAITVELHRIKRVIALTHRDCGAARLALGEAAVATRAAETASHGEILRAFAAETRRRQSGLNIFTGIMDLDGRVDAIG